MHDGQYVVRTGIINTTVHSQIRLIHSCEERHQKLVTVQIKSNLFAISLVHNIKIRKFALRLAEQAGDNFALMSAHDN